MTKAGQQILTVQYTQHAYCSTAELKFHKVHKHTNAPWKYTVYQKDEAYECQNMKQNKAEEKQGKSYAALRVKTWDVCCRFAISTSN